jgi:hypothetical protein
LGKRDPGGRQPLLSSLLLPTRALEETIHGVPCPVVYGRAELADVLFLELVWGLVEVHGIEAMPKGQNRCHR